MLRTATPTFVFSRYFPDPRAVRVMRPPDAPVVALLALALLVTGCAGFVPGQEHTPSPAPGSPTAGPVTGTETQTTDHHRAAVTQPDATKEVRLENAWNRTVSVQVRVVREATTETVHEGTYDVAPDAERMAVYNFSDADPDGIESFTVVVRARNATERVTIETNRCYGNVYGEIQDDGGLYVYYEIC
jgi:hypothetical protein